MRSFVATVVVILSGLLISACGGGSSGDEGSGGGTQPPTSFSVSTSTRGTGSGAISPTSQSVTPGNITSFTISPGSGSSIAGVSGCDGSLSGSNYTTGAISSSCTVTATFDINVYTVTATAGSGGSISPSSRAIAHGETTTFSVAPNSGEEIQSVTGCAGTLSGNIYTTGPITVACSVAANFRATSVTPPPTTEPATSSITASSQLVPVNSQVTLTWSSTNASSCNASGDWDGALQANGTQVVQPTIVGTAIFSVTCGGASASVEVTVLPEYVAIPDPVLGDALTRLGFAVTNSQMLMRDALQIERLCITSMYGFYGPPDSNHVAVFENSSVPDSGTSCAYTLSDQYITEMTGIEAMLNLKSFRIEKQQFSTIDLAQLEDLTFFSLWGNPISTLDLSNNKALEIIGLSETSLTYIDISMLPAITEVAFQQGAMPPYTLPNGTVVHGFSSVDVSQNLKLRRLYVMRNGLAAIDISNNRALEELWATNNDFRSLDLSNNPNLNYVILSENQLASLNAVGIANGGIAFRFYTDGNPDLNEIVVLDPGAWAAAAEATRDGSAVGAAVHIDSHTEFVSGP